VNRRESVVNKDALSVARASYQRCLVYPRFPDFYKHFLSVCPEVAPMFAGTDFDHQQKLLRHALGALLAFGGQRGGEPNVLSRIAERHSRRDLDVDPSFYDSFVDSIVLSVEEFDPEYSPEVGQSWREAVRDGIDYMKASYDRPTEG